MKRLLFLFCFFLTLGSINAETPAKKPVAIERLDNLSQWGGTGDWAMAEFVSGSTTEKKWKSIKAGKLILFNGKSGKTTNIVSKKSYSDVEVLIEFMIPKSSNSGIYFMERYEVQILDSYGKADDALSYGDCGGIYHRWNEEIEIPKARGYEGTAPTTNASKAPGAWQQLLIAFRAPRFDDTGKKSENARFVKVTHNGVVIHEDVEVTGPTRGGKGGEEAQEGHFIIQGDHGPVAFRKFQITPKSFE
ncbi:DUF1080 domain-containing protein [Verrucomicrobiales bacterium]|nr:DUF1080 domain-containing protein [Verrucomicrobiales bacterium]